MSLMKVANPYDLMPLAVHLMLAGQWHLPAWKTHLSIVRLHWRVNDYHFLQSTRLYGDRGMRRQFVARGSAAARRSPLRSRLRSILLIAGLCAQPVVAQPAAIPGPQLPNLDFTPTPEVVRNYDKYFYFHRDETDFATALADIRECDAYARGLSYRLDGGTFTGGLTGVMLDAIFGSALRRQVRRENMRTCMTFKEYRVYGLPKALWERFNFEEGLSQVSDAQRGAMLVVQARIASGPTPQVGEISE